MLRPLSAAIGTIYTLALPSSAVSSEAYALQQSAVRVVHSIERSEALFGAKAGGGVAEIDFAARRRILGHHHRIGIANRVAVDVAGQQADAPVGRD